ncbi:MAG: hypothetical protein KDD70_12350 [Bdellovibrionales bacterium]|nr:hypothetical protein [Bdellovibrionales bacterium]
MRGVFRGGDAAGILLVTLLSFLGIGSAFAQTFQTSGAGYYQPDFPVAFVAAKKSFSTNTRTGITSGTYRFGLDVLDANIPTAGNHLFIRLPNGTVRKLFPLPVHANTPGLIDTPGGDLTLGTVVEPNISEDGKKIYFSYFHDATRNHSQTGQNLVGADLYFIDLEPIIQNQSIDPNTLTAKRLTTRVLDSEGRQQLLDMFKDAQNPSATTSGAGCTEANCINRWATIYMHAEEMRTWSGKKLVYVSNKRHLNNSNRSQSGYTNHNFNLHIADIQPDGSITNSRQFQYYTTTAAFSPARLRNGISFSYQGTTGDARHWEIQGMDSEGKWYPLIGFGMNPGVMHLGSLCVDTEGSDAGDYFVATRYYNQNNRGFGSIWKQDMSKVGLNTYDYNDNNYILPRQVGSRKLTPSIADNDDPSPLIGGVFQGKGTSPRCSRPNEGYFLAYSFTSANGRTEDEFNIKHNYDSFIGYRPNLNEFEPLDTPSLENGTGILKVVEETSDAYALAWPVPVLSWQERTGDVEQQFSESLVRTNGAVPDGLPVSIVGTSALWNTDRRPFDCWLPTASGEEKKSYNPNRGNQNFNAQHDHVIGNQDGLTYVQNQNDVCEYLRPETVLGVAIQMTSNRIDNYGYNYGGSVTDPNKERFQRETARLLGVYDVRNQADQSFSAYIPSNVPFEFHLLDRRYGMRLTDVRSWHSLKPREARTDCGGCHQHEPGKAIDYSGTIASQSPPADMISQTTFITYDATCNPVVETSNTPTTTLPEWTQDIWPGFNQYCGSCHNQNISSNTSALAALNYTDEGDAFEKLRSRNYASPIAGALGSLAFMAARGERTDGRDNTLNHFQPNYDVENWGFHFSDVHATAYDLCDGTNLQAAQWVYKLGQWIDNHTPRDVPQSSSHQYLPTKFDRYHPSIDGAIVTNDCAPTTLRVGFWDDSGQLSAIEIYRNGNLELTLTDRGNGYHEHSLAGAALEDSIEVIATDPSGNRQGYSKSVAELKLECQIAGNLATPTPTPTATPTPTPTPPGGGNGGAGSGNGGEDGGEDTGGDPSSYTLSSNRSQLKLGKTMKLGISGPEGTEQLRLMCSLNSSTKRSRRLEKRLQARLSKLSPFTGSDGISFKALLPLRSKLVGEQLNCHLENLVGDSRSNDVALRLRGAGVSPRTEEKYNGKIKKMTLLRQECRVAVKQQKKLSNPVETSSIPTCKQMVELQQLMKNGRAFR